MLPYPGSSAAKCASTLNKTLKYWISIKWFVLLSPGSDEPSRWGHNSLIKELFSGIKDAGSLELLCEWLTVFVLWSYIDLYNECVMYVPKFNKRVIWAKADLNSTSLSWFQPSGASLSNDLFLLSVAGVTSPLFMHLSISSFFEYPLTFPGLHNTVWMVF